MSLATRCTACGTVFRVVQDQLKVSEGWVRCGRCSEVFNALEGLFDLNRDAPPNWSPGLAADPLQPAAHLATPSADDTPQPEHAESFHRIDEQLMASRLGAHQSTPAARVSERDRLEFPDARFDPDLLKDDPDAISGYESTVFQALGEEPLVIGDSAPEFLRQAQRAQRWRSPGRRAGLGAIALVLALALALQGAHHFRDLIAARWPATQPALTAWCRLAECALQAPRRIEDLSVENTALEPAGIADAYKLSVSLHNRGNLVVALPSFDLTLTDPAGQLLARRVLSPRDFRVTTPAVAPGAETAMQLVLSAGGAKVAGYTVEIFYP